MTEVTIHRVTSQIDYTAGVIIVGGTPVCVSIELPWRDNRRNISCIPEGRYKVDTHHQSPTKGACWHILDVPDRKWCLLHVANRARELRGCCAPGLRFGKLEGEFAVLSSATALEALNSAIRGEQFINLHVIDGWRNIAP